VKYCEHHNYTKPELIIRPLQSNELSQCLKDQWDVEFINQLSFEQITDLLLASEALMCEGLADLCYAKIALYFRGKK